MTVALAPNSNEVRFEEEIEHFVTWHTMRSHQDDMVRLGREALKYGVSLRAALGYAIANELFYLYLAEHGISLFEVGNPDRYDFFGHILNRCIRQATNWVYRRLEGRWWLHRWRVWLYDHGRLTREPQAWHDYRTTIDRYTWNKFMPILAPQPKAS